MGELEEGGDVGGVVECAVVEVVAVDGGAEAVAVEVGGEGDVLGGEGWVGSREDGDDVGGGDVFLGELEFGAEGEGQWQGWEGQAFFAVGDDPGGVGGGAGEEFGRGLGGDAEAEDGRGLGCALRGGAG